MGGVGCANLVGVRCMQGALAQLDVLTKNQYSASAPFNGVFVIGWGMPGGSVCDYYDAWLFVNSTRDTDAFNVRAADIVKQLRSLESMPAIGGRSGKTRVAQTQSKWLPTRRSIHHKGALRKVWTDSRNAAVLAVKRIVKAADGSKKTRFEKL